MVRVWCGRFYCPIEKPEPTFADYQQTWLAQSPAHCKQSTVDYYVDYQQRHILPRFGSLRLSDITVSRIRTVIAELKEQGLAKNTIRLAVASLRIVLSLAVDENLLPSNPAFAKGGLGTRAITSNKEKREPQSIEPEEADRFLQAASEDPYLALFFIALRAGLRQGEILALRWQDIDFSQKPDSRCPPLVSGHVRFA
jgi:integrase